MDVRVRRRPAVAKKRRESVRQEPHRRATRRKAFSALFRPEKGLAGRRPVKASLYPQQTEALDCFTLRRTGTRSEEHTSELQSLMRISYAVLCLKKKNNRLEKVRT